MANQSRLSVLDLSSVIQMSDDGLVSIISHSTGSLKTIKVAGCINLSDSSFLYLAKCQNLVHLEVNSCNVNYSCSSLISDEAVRAISMNCRLLQAINLFNCELITDYGAAAIGELQSLTSLDLSYCSAITDVLPYHHYHYHHHHN